MVRKGWIYVTQIALSLVMVCGLVTGCGVLSSTPAPPSSPYPADLSGYVTIADKITVNSKSGKPMEFGQPRCTYWIVEVSVRNKTYEKPISETARTSAGVATWALVVDGVAVANLENTDIFTPEPMSALKGQTGKTTFAFEIYPAEGYGISSVQERVRKMEPNNTEICYQGQELYSYGKLTGGDKVAVYDWDLKKAVQEIKDSGELYAVPDEHFQTRNMRLRTVERWTGTESRVIEFDIDKSPWVINGSYEVVSSLGHKFEYIIFTEDEYSVPEEAFQKLMSNQLLFPTRFPAGDHYLVKQSGKFVICVYASGVKWELKVGLE